MKNKLSSILIIAGILIGGGALLPPMRISTSLDTKISVSNEAERSAFATLNGQSRQQAEEQKFPVLPDRFTVSEKLPFVITLADLCPTGTDSSNFSLNSVTLLCRDNNFVKPEDEKNKLTLDINETQVTSDMGTSNFLEAHFGTTFFPFTQPVDLNGVEELTCVLPINTGLAVFRPADNAELFGNEAISSNKIWYPIVRLQGTVPSPLAHLRIPLMGIGILLLLAGVGARFSSRKKVQSPVELQGKESTHAYNAQEFYIQFDNIVSGPFSAEDLRQMISQKQITDKTLACTPLDQSWRPLDKCLKK